ncbi:Peptidoglycan/LPS O-acetylase OafA/YrhL, contains acyltransferase and SGNH-hydrolase domains [Granulicella rosea]|uniref:Peptidoglycan/LPS O-acetylase OafA/YrhL, contains acyltransferase and SGNH-hydrolase domains n=1 Tax=Granulicella rosea TaxID=474952 RepID=A0A239J017_9BACT|nr:acyltransferase [Granulicella rosea]SNS98808.1 Peptidoglycan/LPS O-acetylase OafA/YrhL, contains acyltransferase and SGNH-hydrolase domains [Granulicella rosea]
MASRAVVLEQTGQHAVAASRRNIGLDVLRATAISMVFLAHGVGLEGKPFVGEFGTGVDLFFVLSGFLIGRIYFRSSRKDAATHFSLLGFWRARWWRTLPPYLVALAVYAAVRATVAPQQAPLDWHYLFFLQNYFGVPAFGPSWSLCVEEHFYLLLPLLAYAVERTLGREAFRWTLPVAFFVPLALRILTLSATGALPPFWFWMSHLHCEGMVEGLWLAYLFVERRQQFDRLKPVALALLPLIPLLLIVLPVWKRSPQVNVFVFTLLAVGYAAWLRVLYDLRWTPAGALGRFAYKAIQGLALCAYSIYLTHTTFDQPIRMALGEHMARGAARTGLILAATLGIGVVFYFLVERTSIQTRDRMLGHGR